MGAQKPPSDLTHMRHRRHYICPEIFPKPSRNLPEILRNLIKRLSRGWPVRTYGEAGALARSQGVCRYEAYSLANSPLLL